jgi:hypothetical protein
MNVLPTSKEGVIAAVRALAARVPGSREEMKAIEAESVALALHIQKHTLLTDVPEAVWHFLSDVDIRFKDHRYSEAQLDSLDAVLASWLRGAPSNTSLERTRDR